MLGRHRPGSEGNLASDLENQDPAVTTNGDPEVTNSETESAKTGTVREPAPGKEGAPRSKPDGRAPRGDAKSAGEPKPAVEKTGIENSAVDENDGEKDDGGTNQGEIAATEAAEAKPEAEAPKQEP